MIVLDISIVITGLPKIRESLGFSATGQSWVHSAYTLAIGLALISANFPEGGEHTWALSWPTRWPPRSPPTLQC